MAITLDDYFGQHGQGHEAEITDSTRAHAKELLSSVAQFLAWARFDGQLASGWRPASFNRELEKKGAAPRSLHMTGEAVDVRDSQSRALARFCRDNLPLIAEAGLYIEDPRATPSWIHFQNRAPASGRIVFIPSHEWAARLAGQPLTNWSTRLS